MCRSCPFVMGDVPFEDLLGEVFVVGHREGKSLEEVALFGRGGVALLGYCDLHEKIMIYIWY